MQIYTAQLSDDITTAPALNAAYIGHPEVLERVTKQICNEYQYYFTGMALGYGRYITDADIQKNTDKLTIGNDYVTWAVKPRFRQLVTLQAQIASGAGAGNATFTMTLGPNDQWLRNGMIIKYTYPTTGAYVLFYIISGPVANSANWNYTVKLFSNASATVPANIVVNSTLGQTSIASSTCTTTTTYMPKKFLDQFRNYNTTMKPKHTFCKDGIATVTWYKSDDGQKCWRPQEEHDWEREVLKDLEFGIVYNESSVNSAGTVYMTDANGDTVMVGSGLLEQIASGNNITYNVNTYYHNPTNYQALLYQIEEVIENWSIQYGITSDVTLYIHAGKKAFGMLQDVFKGFADQSGGCCFIFNYRNGTEDEMSLSKNIIRYKFSSFTLMLLNCSVFDDPGVHGTAQSGASYLAPPLESFRFLIAPDTDCEGNPLLSLYFRGGCGLDDVWNSNYTPGTIDPYGRAGGTSTNGFKSHINVSDYSGYSLGKEVEWNLINRDPSKWLNFTPFQQ